MSCPDRTASPPDTPALADILAKDGQLLLPMLDLIENAQCAVNYLIDVTGLRHHRGNSADEHRPAPRPKQQSKKSDRDVDCHCYQSP